MDITLVELFNPMLKMKVRLSRTSNKKFKFSKQITPVRNIWVDEIYDDLEKVKYLIIGELINGFELKINNMGLTFIDEILAPLNEAIEKHKEKELLTIEKVNDEPEECNEEELSEAIKKGLEWC